MLKINNITFEKKYFPDGTQCLLDTDAKKYDIIKDTPTIIKWSYSNDEECMTLYYLVKHIKNMMGKDYPILLDLFYCPNARMDRVKSSCEVFTLKWFADFINDLKFDKVYVLDPHSNVTTALINNVVVVSPLSYIDQIGEHIKDDDSMQDTLMYGESKFEDLYIFFPDAGAMKRYCGDIHTDRIIYGEKDRDWKTGEIRGIKIFDVNGNSIEGNINQYNEPLLYGKIVLMIDDIISYGGTLAYSADKLKTLGAKKIYAYATHTENSVLDKEKGTLLKRLENNTVQRIFTTDSIYCGNHDKITVLN